MQLVPRALVVTACALAACSTAPANDQSNETSSGDTSLATGPQGSEEDSTTNATTSNAGSSGPAQADSSSSDTVDPDSGSSGEPSTGRVHVVLFTHIEDASPPGMLGTPESITQFMAMRARMIEMAELADSHGLQWVLQPDWKILEAALQYEDAEATATTNGKGFLQYLREDLGVVIDPHSHENGGYNYTDVAHLLESLEVGGSTVIGGHIWDPSLAQFQEWDRFREPVDGIAYPDATWRGDILIGSGTPNHVNDPIISGIWRPLDRDNYWTDDPDGNIVAVGAWHEQVSGVQALVDAYADGTVPPERLLTASWNVTPTEIMATDGLAAIEQDVLLPLVALRDDGLVVVTDFTTLIDTWQTDFGGEAYVYEP